MRVSGNVGRTTRSTVFLDGRVVALEVGGESYARAAVGFASGKLHKAKPALEKVKRGLVRADAEGTLSHDQARQRLGKWLAN